MRLGVLLATAVLATSVEAFAQSADQEAAAEMLFRQGTALMQKEDYAAACAKFEESYAVDPALGTLGWLADCHERVGRTASAWAEYQEVASKAEQAGQVERQRLAEEGAARVAANLSYLTLDATATRDVGGVEVFRNGRALHRSLWGVAVPVDPGEHVVEVRAPGRVSNSVRVSVGPNGARATLALPALVPVTPVSEAAPAPAAQPAPVAPAPSATPAPLAPPPPNTDPTSDAPAARGGSTQRLLGYVGVGAGAVGLGLGVAFYLSRNSHVDARDAACPAVPDGDCPSEDARLEYEAEQADAKNAAKLATISSIAGGVLGATGVVLLLTAPSASGASTRVRIAPLPIAGGMGVSGSTTW